MYKFFSKYENVIAVTSVSQDGDMKLRGESTEPKVLENRKAFCKKNNIDYKSLVSASIEHTSNVVFVDKNSGQLIEKTDALITKEKNLYLSVTSADCFPVFFYDKKNEIVGIAHAGWRGIVGEIIPRTIDAMKGHGAESDQISVIIGPGISQEHFDFGLDDIKKEFGSYNKEKYFVNGDVPEKVKVDLRKIIFDQLEKTGIKQESIEDSGMCTYKFQDDFFSARRDGGDCFSAMISVIGIKK